MLHAENRRNDGTSPPGRSSSSSSGESREVANHEQDNDGLDDLDDSAEEYNEDEDEEILEAQPYVAEFFEGFQLADLLDGPGL